MDTVKQSMQLERAGIILVEKNNNKINYKIAKVVGFDEKDDIHLMENDFLASYLQRKQKPLVAEELAMQTKEFMASDDGSKILGIEKNMKENDISLCVPLISNKKLIGIIVLGSKVSRDAYTKEDLDLLNTLANQAGIAIENAIFYKQIQDFSKTLQQKVDEQTKEIREQKDKVEKAYELEKQAHEELKQVDDAKSQFMMVTQHHLRTPLTGMMGYLDLLMSNSYGKVPVKIKEVLKRMQGSTTNELKVINDLLSVSSYQMGKEVIKIEKGIDVNQMLEEIIGELEIEAKNKGIYLKFNKNNSSTVPTISADRNSIRAALTNIIDNAVKYTQQGGVEVNLKSENKKILVSVKDTGIGMSQDSTKNLFNQTFHRGQEAQKIFAVGKGIGLFLSGKIIESHRGKIWAESEGEGKGSTFYVELPVV